MAKVTAEQLDSSKRLSGPFSLFENSFIVEFLEPPDSLDATVLMKATYPISTSLCKLGTKHPQSPPLHLHFDQSESFLVQQGKVGTTTGYEVKQRGWTKEDGIQEIVPWMPHSFWPHPEAQEDTTIYVWAHPEQVADPMDWLFFQNLLRLVGDAHDTKSIPNLFQVMVLQHASATAMVWFPGAWWLGPLRWWVPWKVQAGIAALGKALGYRALSEKYTPKEEWEEYVHAKRT